MTMTDTIDTVVDIEAVKQQYEKLRANALGELNRAPLLNVFLRSGMNSWLISLRMRNPGYLGHSFRPSPDTYSGKARTVIPGEAGHF